MQFLKILFWCLLAFVAATFTTSNWFSVPVRLPGGLIAETNLPLLVFVAVLLGAVPTLAYQHLRRWRLRQRIASTERQLAELRALAAVAPRPAPAPTAAP
jgi:uncharacterized integral membrane protein